MFIIKFSALNLRKRSYNKANANKNKENVQILHKSFQIANNVIVGTIPLTAGNSFLPYKHFLTSLQFSLTKTADWPSF